MFQFLTRHAAFTGLPNACNSGVCHFPSLAVIYYNDGNKSVGSNLSMLASATEEDGNKTHKQ